MSVSSQDILSGKNDLLKRNLDEKHKSYNAWILECSADCRYFLFGNAVYCFCFSEINKYNSSSDIANGERFIVLVQNQNLPVQIAGMFVIPESIILLEEVTLLKF